MQHDLGRNLLVDPNVGLAVDLNLERHDHTIVSVHKLSQLVLAPSRLRSKLKDLTTARFELTRLVGRRVGVTRSSPTSSPRNHEADRNIDPYSKT